MRWGRLNQRRDMLERDGSARPALLLGHSPTLDLSWGNPDDPSHSRQAAKILDEGLCWFMHSSICAIFTQIVKRQYCVLRIGRQQRTCAK